jgi:hypothetical protein
MNDNRSASLDWDGTDSARFGFAGTGTEAEQNLQTMGRPAR